MCKDINVPIGEHSDVILDGTRPERCAVFIHPRSEEADAAAYLSTCSDHTAYTNIQSFRPDPEKDKRVTMNKKQKALVTKGEA